MSIIYKKNKKAAKAAHAMLFFEAASSSQAIGTVNSLLSSISIVQPTWDIFLILFFIVAGFFYGLFLGRDRIIVVLLTIYVTLALMHAAPFLKIEMLQQAGIENVFAFQVAIFFFLFLIVFLLLGRSALLTSVARSDARGRWWQVILLSVAHVGLLISITLYFFPPEMYEGLSSLTREYFTGEKMQFFWLVAPIVCIALVRERDDFSR